MLLGHGMKRLRKLSTHSRKNFQISSFLKDLISTRFSFYIFTGILLCEATSCPSTLDSMR
jgi:hypothetical protein